MLTVEQMCSVWNRDGKDLHFTYSTPECQLLCFHWWLSRQGSAGFYWSPEGLVLGFHCSWSMPTLLSQPALFNTARAGNSSCVLLPVAGLATCLLLGKRAGDGVLLEVYWKFACRWDWPSIWYWSSPVKDAIMRDKSNGGFFPFCVFVSWLLLLRGKKIWWQRMKEYSDSIDSKMLHWRPVGFLANWKQCDQRTYLVTFNCMTSNYISLEEQSNEISRKTDWYKFFFNFTIL